MGAVKKFDEFNRQEKRHAYVKIKYQGKWIDLPVIKYLEMAAKSLPRGFREDGTEVDHLSDLKKIYYKTDIDGVKEYIKSVEKIMKETIKRERNKNKPLWRRVLNV